MRNSQILVSSHAKHSFLLALILCLSFLPFVSALPLDNGLVSYWNNDQSTSPLIDQKNIINWTGVGTPLFLQSGIKNYSIGFNSNDDYFTANSCPNNLFFDTTKDFSMSIWFKTNEQNGDRRIFESHTTQPQYQASIITGGNVQFSIETAGGGTGVFLRSDNAINDSEWHNLAFIRNDTGTDYYLYIDGILNDVNVTGNLYNASCQNMRLGDDRGTSYFNGFEDEIKIWNRSVGLEGVLANLIPLKNIGSSTGVANGTKIFLLGNHTFNFENITGLNNVSLYINGVLNETKTVNSGSVEFYKIFSTQQELFISYEFCSSTSCSQSDNLSMEVTGLTIDAEQFSATAYETAREEFYINITGYKDILSATAILNYNGTRYTSVEECSGDFCEISTAINIPIGSATNDFFWEITAFFSDDSASINSTTQTQTINPIALAVCNATYTEEAINFTVFDEETKATVTPFRFESTINYWLGTGLTYKTFTYSNSSISESLQLCISPGTEEFIIDGQIEYDESTGTNYSSRNYFFEEYEITNDTEDIKLGLLKAEDSTSFIIVVQDNTISPIQGALVYTQRYYPGTNEYVTVQVSQTDANGKTVGFFKTETVDYRFIVEYNGTVVLITNKQKIIPETTPYTITLTIGETTGVSWEGFEEIAGFDATLTWNATTQIATLTYIDSTGNLTNSRLLVELIRVDELTNLQVCSKTSSLSSATLTCNLTGNSTGTYSASYIATFNGEQIVYKQITIIISNFASELDTYGIFISIIVLLTLITTFYFNFIIGLFSINLGIIGLNYVGFINVGGGLITGIIALSIIIAVVSRR